MKKTFLVIILSLMMLCLLPSCSMPNGKDTKTDTQNTDTGSDENNNSVKKPLEATEEINGYYPFVYAGELLIDEHKVEDGNYYDECFYEIFTYEDFCASVEFPSALSAQDFVDNYVLVLRRCHHSSYDIIGLKDYNSKEQTISVADVLEVNRSETEDISIFYYYLLIPQTTPSSYETNSGKTTGNLNFKNTISDQYYYDFVEANDAYEGYVNIFDSISEANEFLTSNQMKNIDRLCFDNLSSSKLLAVYVNNSLNDFLYTGHSSFLGFSDLRVDQSGNIEVTIQRSIVDNYYGENDKGCIFFVEIPNTALEGYSPSFKLNLKVKDHIVSTRHPNVTYYDYISGLKRSVKIIKDKDSYLVEVDYLDGSKKYVVFDENRNVISSYNINLIDFALPANKDDITVEAIQTQYGDFVTNYEAGDIGAYITNDACIVYFSRYEDTIYGLYKIDIIEDDFEVLWSPDS